MTIALSSPLTGLAQTGLTSPTYTFVSDQAPDVNAKQVAVTTLGGTQTGVTTHSSSSPFITATWKPKAFQILGKPNPVTGLLPNVPVNVYKVITIKGVTPLSGQPVARMIVTTSISVPAGSDIADPANVRAALSMHFGALSQASAGIGDTSVTGLM